MSNTAPLAKTYTPADVEPEILTRWNDSKAFHAVPEDPGKAYCIVIPPPNVTAALHMGHALNNTIQDILIRWRRMCGDNAIWMPGTDHAGIATQSVVEKRVLEETGRKRTFFTREEFVAKIQRWKDEYEARITNQLRAMGCSCDWDRQAFTLDEPRAKAVREAFFRMFEQGLIYRGKRLVNWDPATQTALADDEVEMEDVDGFFWYMKYPVVEQKGNAWSDTGEYVTVATTRPETMLGDTAVAVNPKDAERAKFLGKHVRLPIVNRIIPIIGDDYVVIPDPESDDAKAKYASGFLKVTPAHDPNDYDIGQRHFDTIAQSLGGHRVVINVLAPDGTISREYGWPQDEWSGMIDEDAVPLGMDRYEAREAIVEWFRRNDLLEDVKPYRHAVGHSYRSHVAIEPYLSDQWYVKVTDDRLAGAALRAMVRDQFTGDDGKPVGTAPEKSDAIPRESALRFHPPRYAKTFQTWHENLRDWCISRQLWWGHRIPVWSVEGIKGINLAKELEGTPDLVIHRPTAQAIAYFCPRTDDHPAIAKITAAGGEQDPDVLDTWFSSALWPFSTLGWPDKTPELARWNPGNVLCTAREIITLWVSRMVMTNLFFLDQLPFTDVFIHAMIQDGEGRKMSKSLGNGVDPLDIISSHGADAMRYTLAMMTTDTQDVRMPVKRDEATGKNTSDKFDVGRNFANKLWNAVRFALSNLEEGPTLKSNDEDPQLSLADRWILSRLATTVRDSDRALGRYEFNTYAQGLYDFIWRDLCDWYIEAVKPKARQNASQCRVLALCIDAALRLLHPVMPFVTEKLWERLNEIAPHREISGVSLTPSALLVHASWPKVSEGLIDKTVEADFALLQRIVSAVREARATYKISPKQRIEATAKASASLAAKLVAFASLAETLCNIGPGEVGPKVERPADAAVIFIDDVELYLHNLVDADAERTRLTKQLAEAEKSVKALEGRLANPKYVDKAPAHLVNETREQLAAAKREEELLRSQLSALANS